MRLPSPEVRATWPPANYENPETRGPALLIVQLIMLPIALIVLVLRFYVRIRIMGSIDADDWFMVAAALSGTGVTVSVILASSLYGWNLHIWDLKYENLVHNRKVTMAVQALFISATGCAKTSILLSYLRLAPRGSLFRKLAYAIIAFVALYNTAFAIVLFAQCQPTSSYWNILFSSRDCIPEGPPLLTHASLTVLADFLVWILPLPTLYRARLPLSQRIALIVLFSFGGVVVIGAILRLYWIWYVLERTYDITWEGFHLLIWTAVEVHLGVICGCVPWLKSLVKFWKNGGSTAAGYSHNQNGSRSLGKMAGSSKGGKLNAEEDGADFRRDRGAMFRMVSVNGKNLDSNDAYMDLDSNDGSSTVRLDVGAEPVNGK
ncbi:hypothetical protein QBC40DRAFT_188922 [Triangularia verruculosa]|uniref:Rhodopsin domain-containing protein n=1 Tax=Triangularia verruculosa TaxID=2587418 RepID=A0AAN6X4X1_9PEZI|nr:hypothetical protein QBC40DRAFT_188922 [Triangularia verruculosa]